MLRDEKCHRCVGRLLPVRWNVVAYDALIIHSDEADEICIQMSMKWFLVK
jgi:hypothetical protein